MDQEDESLTAPAADDAPASASGEAQDVPALGYGESASQADTDFQDYPDHQAEDAGQKSAAETLLDSLSAETEPAGTGPSRPEAAARPPENAARTPEQEEAELLEGVKSERGKERIRQVFAERKQLEADIDEIRDMVRSTGMEPQEFAHMLEFGRLVSAGDEKSLMVALQMVEAQRTQICKRLGIEAPGVNALAEFPDLGAAVNSREITREHALQLAKYRRQEHEQRLALHQHAQSQQEMRDFHTRMEGFKSTSEAYFKTREKEVDFVPKIKKMHEYFQNPQNMARFVSNFEPHQWLAQLQFMYDNMAVAPQRPSGQPLRSRPSNTGSAAPKPGAPLADRLMSHLDALGI